MTATKGPWEAPGKDGDAYVVCTAKSHGKRRTVGHAYSPSDAALIAAAPDMQVSCKALASAKIGRDFSEAAISGDASDDLPITVVMTLGDIRRARAVMSKVEG